jgi:hypothetical protein
MNNKFSTQIKSENDSDNFIDLNIELNELISTQFNPKLLLSAFHQSICNSTDLADSNDVFLKEYLIAYEEIIKFLNCMGSVFYFVITDIKEKIEILESYLKINPDNYSTIKKIVEYEKKENLISKQPTNNGCRTILRLHRALIFIYYFIENLLIADNKNKSYDIAQAAYEKTLGKS